MNTILLNKKHEYYLPKIIGLELVKNYEFWIMSFKKRNYAHKKLCGFAYLRFIFLQQGRKDAKFFLFLLIIKKLYSR